MRWRTSLTVSAALGLGALGFGAPGARANPLDMYGFGSRSIALGGAVSADAADVSANYYNPAGLARATGLRGEIGYVSVAHSFALNGRDTNVDPAQGLAGGLVAPGRLFGLRFAFGLGFYLPDDRLSRTRALPQGQPRWELYDVRVQRLFIAANVAVAPFPWLRLGGGLAFMASTRGRIEIDGQLSFTSPDDSVFTHSVDADLTAVRYPQVGAQVDLGRGVTAALAWRGQFNLDLALDATLRGQIFIGHLDDPNTLSFPGRYDLASRTLTAFQPQQVVAGAAWRLGAGWTVMADLTWVQWSAYENPTAATVVSLDLRLPAGFPTVRVPPPAVREPTRFSDTVVPRVGVEHVHPLGRHAVALRAGYRFDATPVPDQTGATNFVDCTRHVVALGAGVILRRLGAALPGELALDLHVDFQYLVPRAVTKASPVDPVGDYVASGTALGLGATASVSFP